MRVGLFLFYPGTLWTPGGGERLVRETHSALRGRGVDAELFDIWKPRQDFDILHVIGSTEHVFGFVQAAKRLGNMKVVVTAIHDTARPSWQWAMLRHACSLFPFATRFSWRRGSLELADTIVVASRTEAEMVRRHFALTRSRVMVVPYGLDAKFVKASPGPFIERFGVRDFVLQVSRINRKKGQIRTIEAMSGMGLPLVIVGESSMDDPTYFARFLTVCDGKPWVHYVGRLPEELLPSAYAAARVHVLPTLSETAGLVNLEAAAAGANVVTSDLPIIREYLGDVGFYCNPNDARSIRSAVGAAFGSERRASVRAAIIERFGWGTIVDQLMAVYEETLNGGALWPSPREMAPGEGL